MSANKIEEQFLAVLTRIADALDRAIPLNINEPNEPLIQLSPEEQAEQDRLNDELAERYLRGGSTMEEELRATVERLEDAGQYVPDDMYKKLRLDPPKRGVPADPDADMMSAPQPGTPGTAEQHEPAQPDEPARPDLPAYPSEPDPLIISTRKPGVL